MAWADWWAEHIYGTACHLAKQAALPRIEARLAEAGDGADREAIAGEELAAVFPAAFDEAERVCYERDYEPGSCGVCQHEPARPGYRWVRWIEKVPVEGEALPRNVQALPMRVRRSVEEWCPWLACPHRPADEVAIMCGDCAQVAIVMQPGLPAVCPKCGGTMRRAESAAP